MDEPALPLLGLADPGPNTGGGAALDAPRRGRPKGAKNRRSADLARYVEAQYGGMTPGQQGAAIGMVSGRELRAAKRDLAQARAAAREAGEAAPAQLDPHLHALVTKAKALASALGCKTPEAWALMARERADLLPYVHQRQPLAIDNKGAPLAQVFVVPGGAAPPLGQVVELDEGEWGEAADPLAFPLPSNGSAPAA